MCFLFELAVHFHQLRLWLAEVRRWHRADDWQSTSHVLDAMLEIYKPNSDALDSFRILLESYLQWNAIPSMGCRAGTYRGPRLASLVYFRRSFDHWSGSVVDSWCGPLSLIRNCHRRRLGPSILSIKRAPWCQWHCSTRTYRVWANGVWLQTRWIRRNVLSNLHQEKAWRSRRWRINHINSSNRKTFWRHSISDFNRYCWR